MVVSSHTGLRLPRKDEIEQIIVAVYSGSPDELENHKVGNVEVKLGVVSIIDRSDDVKFINLPQFQNEDEN